MKRIKHFNEEPNKLLKVRIYSEGSNQFRLKPVSDLSGRQVNKGEFRFRGTKEEFSLVLRRLKAKDHKTDPASAKNDTYKNMIDDAISGVDPYIWIWSNMWSSRNTIQSISK